MVSSSLGMAKQTFIIKKQAWQKRKRQERRIGRLTLVGILGVSCLWGLWAITDSWLLPSLHPLPNTQQTLQALNKPVQDSAHYLSLTDTQTITELLSALNTMLQANSHLLLQHPLPEISTSMLAQRDIVLAFDPKEQRMTIHLGPGLQQGSNSAVLFLNGNSQAFLQSELIPLSKQSLALPVKLELMLKLIGQHFAPTFSHAKMRLPESG